MDRILHISNHGVDPGESIQGDTGGASARHNRLVYTAGILDGIKTAQTIRDNVRTRLQMLTRPIGDFFALEAFDFGQAHSDCMAFLIGFHSRHKGSLARSSPAAFPASTLTTSVGVVQLDNTRERLRVVTLLHYLHQLVLHAPGSFVRDAQLSFHFQGRYPTFGLGQYVHAQKPQCQWQLGVLEDRAADERCLVMTAMALIDLSGSNLTVSGMAALRTDKSVGPAPLEQSVVTLLFGTIGLQKSRYTEPFLELNLVFCHDLLLSFISDSGSLNR